jgi:Transposase, Mutator family
MLTVVPGPASGDEDRPTASDSSSLIDLIVREGARRMLAEALQAEVDAYIAAYTDQRDEHGHRLVVRNGCHQPREVLTSAGAVEVTAPRVNDRRIDLDTGERQRFSSAILPPWARKTPKITEVLPLLYLHGLSSGDFVPALGQFLGSAKGLSAPVITKLTELWKAEQRTFADRDLSDVDYVYLWADGIHVNIRLEEAKLCLLVMIGVRADGRQDHRGRRRAARLLRLPRRALGASAHHQPHRVDLLHGPAPDEAHQGTRLARGRARDGLQADRVSIGPLARGQRTPPRRARPRRRPLRQRKTRRTTRRPHPPHSSLKDLHPQA